jgi:hypothetical protein
VNVLQRDQALRQATDSLSQTGRALFAKYHQACIDDVKARLVTAPIELVPGLQAEATVHIGILNALTAGA